MLRDSRAILERLRQDGFIHASTSGSHHKFRHPDGRMVIVPHPRKDIARGTVHAIYKQAG